MIKTLIRLLAILLPFAVDGQDRSWEVAVAGGGAHNFRTPLHVQQRNAEDIEVDARYRTEPFKPPVYYDVRVSNWQNERGWELKFTHHKLILDNLPPQVQRFSITNGYNLLSLNRLWQLHGLTFSAGAGLVITHPESTIFHKAYPENKGIFNKGYYISGPLAEVAVAKRYYFSKRWFILAEGRFTASYVEVPVANGEASLSQMAVHGLLGLGFKVK
ncbi:hypothetical protein [Pontibacter anaerobius]|uniref:Outer membrane protein beta-barrel domain-containing protein n=1 Tax=Pontibacter anaerobius TaxID=2993940 RepID=A0ABT3RHG4_9BACT|nr:hypothetical protein [Pontibacter anaerobius]MCX2741215.1 hypothetical protein [Pontibacter anaerobius]